MLFYQILFKNETLVGIVAKLIMKKYSENIDFFDASITVTLEIEIMCIFSA